MKYDDDIDSLYATYQSLLPMAEADSARLWQKFRLDWNYNSNRIEGNTLTRGETKELLEQGIKPVRMRKDILQMQSHDKAIDVLRDLAKSERPLTEADIRALHKTALGENYWTEAITADGTITRREIEIGVYKKRPNMVLKSDGSEHIYATPQEVPARMATTIKRLRKYLKKPDDALHDYLAELHQEFIETHPFDDGNGRVVRLLVNYVCLHLGWPPVIIKSDKRSEYIASLESWNDGDETPFRELMKRELIWSLKKSIAAARGEDIEDDGDLDKEISFVVQEAMSIKEIPSYNEKKIERICELYFIPAIEKSAERFKKFSPHFERTKITNFHDEIRQGLKVKRKGFNIGMVHTKEKNRINPQSYDLTFKAEFFDDHYLISAYIIYSKDAVGKKVDFAETSYDDSYNKQSLDGFHNKVGKEMLSQFKAMLSAGQTLA